MHVHETEDVWTEPPAGFERDGMVWQLKRVINGRRKGGKEFADWLSCQLKQMDYKRSRICAAVFIHPQCQCVVEIHVDDFKVHGSQ
eukprot:1169315-Alexandrium_andersonii.AAC.1